MQHIEAQLAWGEGSTWTNKDFQELSERIFDHTRQQLSVTTLKRVWGRAERVANPSGATLDILAEFAGYGSWRAFRQQQSLTLPQNGSPPSRPRSRRSWKMVSGAILLLVLLSLGWYALQDRKTPNSNLSPLSDSIRFPLRESSLPATRIRSFSATTWALRPTIRWPSSSRGTPASALRSPNRRGW